MASSSSSSRMVSGDDRDPVDDSAGCVCPDAFGSPWAGGGAGGWLRLGATFGRRCYLMAAAAAAASGLSLQARQERSCLFPLERGDFEHGLWDEFRVAEQKVWLQLLIETGRGVDVEAQIAAQASVEVAQRRKVVMPVGRVGDVVHERPPPLLAPSLRRRWIPRRVDSKRLAGRDERVA
ncbi:hypothetical protein L1887_55080 [Cichorium endivia]|nr:hypothetical protein L1887_55080 [Cichorium endivia]